MIKCEHHPDRPVEFTLTLYTRAPIKAIWHGMGCADCIEQSRALMKRTTEPTAHLLLLLPVSFTEKQA